MSARPERDDAELIGRSYTKARRSALVYGMVPGGDGRNFRLPFGPYTVTQLGVLVGSVLVLVGSRPVWGGRGVADLVVLVVVPFGASFALRHLHLDGRNPAAAAVSVAVMLAGPRWGRLHDRPYRSPAARRVAPCITVSVRGAAWHPAAAGGPVAVPGAGPRPGGSAVASGVQTLLTQRTSRGTDR